mmetsp:Transcript_7081/g.18257  ORF Transcript_7081/g.18257 Transcript_7081/m.18257 type:complete len:408 (-) Transcript_7081:1765-2988(-)
MRGTPSIAASSSTKSGTLNEGLRRDKEGGLISCLFRAILQLLFTFFVNNVEVVGGENVPKSGPVVVVSTHPGGILDNSLTVFYCKRRILPIGRDKAAKNPVIGFFLRYYGYIPIKKAEDYPNASDRRQNDESLQAAIEHLRLGGGLLVYPEGKSHLYPCVLPFKHGTSKIVLQAVVSSRRPVQVVPLSVSYSNKVGGDWSNVLLRFGHPLEVSPSSPAVSLYEKSLAGESTCTDERQKAYRQLSEKMREAMKAISPFPSDESWNTFELSHLCAQLFLPSLSPPLSPSELEEVRSAAERLVVGAGPGSCEVTHLQTSLQRYALHLSLLKVGDEDVRRWSEQRRGRRERGTVPKLFPAISFFLYSILFLMAMPAILWFFPAERIVFLLSSLLLREEENKGALITTYRVR